MYLLLVLGKCDINFLWSVPKRWLMSSCSNFFSHPVYNTFIILADQFSTTIAVSCICTRSLKISGARLSSYPLIPKCLLLTRVSSIIADDFSLRTLWAIAVQPTRLTQALKQKQKNPNSLHWVCAVVNLKNENMKRQKMANQPESNHHIFLSYVSFSDESQSPSLAHYFSVVYQFIAWKAIERMQL